MNKKNSIRMKGCLVMIVVLCFMSTGGKLKAQDSTEAILQYALTALSNDSFEVAIKNFDEYMKLVGNNPEAYFKRGLSYFYLGKYFEATDDVNKAILLDSNYAEAYNIRGLISKRLKN